MNKLLIHKVKILKDKKRKLAVSTWGYVHRWFVQFFFLIKKYLMMRLKAFSSKPVLGVVESFTVCRCLTSKPGSFCQLEVAVLLLSSAPTTVVMK